MEMEMIEKFHKTANICNLKNFFLTCDPVESKEMPTELMHLLFSVPMHFLLLTVTFL